MENYYNKFFAMYYGIKFVLPCKLHKLIKPFHKMLLVLYVTCICTVPWLRPSNGSIKKKTKPKKKFTAKFTNTF